LRDNTDQRREIGDVFSTFWYLIFQSEKILLA
jgi:hypothetical protein